MRPSQPDVGVIVLRPPRGDVEVDLAPHDEALADHVEGAVRPNPNGFRDEAAPVEIEAGGVAEFQPHGNLLARQGGADDAGGVVVRGAEGLGAGIVGGRPFVERSGFHSSKNDGAIAPGRNWVRKADAVTGGAEIMRSRVMHGTQNGMKKLLELRSSKEV